MQSSSRAPLLSATLSTDSCWIMSASLLQNFGNAPADFLRDRTCLDDAHTVTDAAALLVVHLEACAVPHDLLVERMRLADLHQHDHRLLHLVAHDDAIANLAAGTRGGGRGHITHRHPPGRRRFPRLPPRAPRTRRREPRRAPPPGPRGGGWTWSPAARVRASAWPRPLAVPAPRAGRGGDRARSRSSRSSRGRSRA